MFLLCSLYVLLVLISPLLLSLVFLCPILALIISPLPSLAPLALLSKVSFFWDLKMRGVSQKRTDDNGNSLRRGDTIYVDKTLIIFFIYTEIHIILSSLFVVGVAKNGVQSPIL